MYAKDVDEDACNWYKWQYTDTEVSKTCSFLEISKERMQHTILDLEVYIRIEFRFS